MNRNIKGITIYCGASGGNSPVWTEAAVAVGRAIASAGLPLIYGGGHMGMMGAASAACREAGGATIAIIPEFMHARGWCDPQSTETVITPDMHSRKELLASHAAGIIALPGGVGTLDELCEIITWRQLGLYHGNIVILNTQGFYDAFIQHLDRVVAAGFLPADHKTLWEVTDDPQQAVALAAAPAKDINLNPKF